MRPVSPRLLRLCLVAVLLGGLGGCDTTVQPIDSQGHSFSIFGLLNPARDTQFVRVEPLGDSIQVGTAPQIDATVTLTHMGTGRTTVLDDSTARFPITGPLGEDVAVVHNFWTTAPLEPGARYRLTVRRSDGAKSWAIAMLPSHPPEIDTVRPPSCGRTDIPAIIRVRTDYLIGTTVVLPSGVRRTDNAKVTARNGFYRLRLPPLCDAEGNTLELIVYAGGPSWPRLSNIGDVSTEALLALDTLSNVRHGVGFVGGAYSSRTEIPIR